MIEQPAAAPATVANVPIPFTAPKAEISPIALRTRVVVVVVMMFTVVVSRMSGSHR